MSPPAHIASLIVLAGFGLAAGIAVLYNIFVNSDSENDPHESSQNQFTLRRRRSPAPTSERSSPSLERSTLRSISPSRQIPAAVRTALNSSSSRRVRRQPREIQDCQICRDPMRNSTKELICGHIFHDACYTIWRHAVVMRNPQAKLCPRC